MGDNSDKKKVPPGWNDPPMLNYSSANPPPKSRITNKRVAFPLDKTATSTSTVPTTSNKPPSNGPSKNS